MDTSATVPGNAVCGSEADYHGLEIVPGAICMGDGCTEHGKYHHQCQKSCEKLFHWGPPYVFFIFPAALLPGIYVFISRR